MSWGARIADGGENLCIFPTVLYVGKSEKDDSKVFESYRWTIAGERERNGRSSGSIERNGGSVTEIVFRDAESPFRFDSPRSGLISVTFGEIT